MKNISNEVKSNLGAQFLVEINDKGWFDQFSDQHFLIRALNNDMDYFNRHRSLINNSSYYSEKNNPINFVVNFSLHFKLFCSHFKEKEMKQFVTSQLSAGKDNYDEEQFFRALAEINVLNLLMAFGPTRECKAIYEPKLGINGSNPEARIQYDNRLVVDVEVKTPGFRHDFSEINTIMPTFLLSDKEKINFKKQCDLNGINFKLPRVSKIIDFINSAGKKFEKPKDEKHINLLYINWTYTEFKEGGIMEPYSILYNNLNGLLKNKDAAIKVGIEEEALEKISAIIVYQDSFDSLIFTNLINLWNGVRFRILPNKLMENSLIDVDIIKSVTRMNTHNYHKDFIYPYMECISQDKVDNFLNVTNYINRRVKGKIKGEDNFTYVDKAFLKKIKKQQRKKMLKY